MAGSGKSEFPKESLQGRNRAAISQAGQEFQQELRAGNQPAIEHYLPRFPESQQGELLRVLLALELQFLHEHSQVINRQAYLRRFPDYQAEIEAVFLAQDLGKEATDTSLWDTDYPGHEPKGAAAVSPIVPAKVLGDYELLAELGRGGMGIVYKARQRSANRIVALKAIRPDILANLPPESKAETLARFRNEVLASARLEHDHVVSIFDVGEVDSQPYYAMRYVEGHSLEELLRRGPLSNETAAKYACQVASALAEAHQDGILHRDVKPHNIMVESRLDRALLADFGLAKLAEDDQQLTATEAVFGSPPYMSPEQATDSSSVTQATDIYGLGATLYKSLTGRPPFLGATPLETMMLVREQEPVPPRKLNPAVNRDLETVCLKCLQKHPGDRYATAADLAEDLKRVLRDEPILARPIGKLQRLGRFLLHKPKVAAAYAAAVAAVAAILLTVLLFQKVQHANKIAGLRAQLESALDDPQLSPQYVQQTAGLIQSLGEISRQETTEDDARLNAIFASSIRQEFRKPKLSTADLENIEASVGALSGRDPRLAEELQAALAKRRNQWEELFALRSPYENVSEIFWEAYPADSNGVRIDQGQFIGGGLVNTKIISRGDVRLQAEFSPEWEFGSQVGLLFDMFAQGKDMQPYRFLLHTRSDSANQPVISNGGMFTGSGPTFAQQRSKQGEVFVEILRGSVPLQSLRIPLASIPSGDLRIYAQKQGDRLTLQINNLDPVAANELFLSKRGENGYFSLLWPQASRLLSLRGERWSASAESSPLEQGDFLYSDGKFSEAERAYAEQINTTAEEKIRLEARFKQARCLQELGRSENARGILEELLGSEHEDWGLLAACQLWLLHLEEFRGEEAERILNSLSTKYDFADLATRVPPNLRTQILSHYEREILGGLAAARPDPGRVERVKRTIDVLNLLGASQDDLYNAKVFLEELYHIQGNYVHSYRLAKEILAEFPTLRLGLRKELMRRIHWALLNFGDTRQTFGDLKQVIYDTNGNLNLPYASLQIELAICHIHMGEKQLAKEKIDNACELYHQLSQNGPSPYMDVGEYQQARFVQGFICEELEDTEGARRAWAAGFDIARKHNELGLLIPTVMGSLSGEYTTADAQRTLYGVVDQTGDSPIIRFLQKGLVPEERVLTVLQNMWRHDRAKKAAREYAFCKLSFSEFNRIQLQSGAYELWRQAVLNTADLEVKLSPQQDLVCWQLCEVLWKEWEEQRVNELHIVQAALTWNGSIGFTGWGTLSPRLKKEPRSYFAYIFGCQYRNIGRLDDAKMLLNQCLRDSPPESELHKLARVELEKLTPN